MARAVVGLFVRATGKIFKGSGFCEAHGTNARKIGLARSFGRSGMRFVSEWRALPPGAEEPCVDCTELARSKLAAKSESKPVPEPKEVARAVTDINAVAFDPCYPDIGAKPKPEVDDSLSGRTKAKTEGGKGTKPDDKSEPPQTFQADRRDPDGKSRSKKDVRKDNAAQRRTSPGGITSKSSVKKKQSKKKK